VSSQDLTLEILVEEHLSTFKEVGFTKAREICPAADLSLMAAQKS